MLLLEAYGKLTYDCIPPALLLWTLLPLLCEKGLQLECRLLLRRRRLLLLLLLLHMKRKPVQQVQLLLLRLLLCRLLPLRLMHWRTEKRWLSLLRHG
jgi:hypothetical protein